MLRLKLYLVDLRGNARYHMAIVPNEQLSTYLNTLINFVWHSCYFHMWDSSARKQAIPFFFRDIIFSVTDK